MKDSLKLMNIYKKYLSITGYLIEILEKHYNQNGDGSSELREKRLEFQKHAHMLLEGFNEDLHKLLKIDWELKQLEEKE